MSTVEKIHDTVAIIHKVAYALNMCLLVLTDTVSHYLCFLCPVGADVSPRHIYISNQRQQDIVDRVNKMFCDAFSVYDFANADIGCLVVMRQEYHEWLQTAMDRYPEANIAQRLISRDFLPCLNKSTEIMEKSIKYIDYVFDNHGLDVCATDCSDARNTAVRLLKRLNSMIERIQTRDLAIGSK
jgi:hypothetical protein